MKLICKQRGTGKTHDLILESAKTGIPILTVYDSKYIEQQAKEMGVKIPHPMSVKEYKKYQNLSNNKWKGKVLVDEIDAVLNLLLGTHVEIATCTPDYMEKEKENKKDMTETYINNVGSALTLDQLEAYDHLLASYCRYPEEVRDFDIIVPGKVVEVYFVDGKKEKMVCDSKDTFDLRRCLFIAIAKHMYKNEYTFEGIEYKADELMLKKRYVKIVDVTLKNYSKKQKAIEKVLKDREEVEKAIARKRAKKEAYKKRRAAKREQEEKDRQIEIQREAILQAMKIAKLENN